MTSIAEKQSKKITKRGGARVNAGGRRSGAGRPVGAVSQEKKALRELAQQHTEDAIQSLAELCTDHAQPGAVRVAAATALLDRGHGRPSQTVEIEGNGKFAAADPVALIALSEAMERSREQRRAVMEQRRQMGFTGD